MKDSIISHPPGRALRFGLRLPIWLYRLRLGWLLDSRFLMLTHTGRKSGIHHQTVIEVVRHDKETDAYYAVSGWGAKADWYQNIQNDPRVTLHVGGRSFQAQAQFIPIVRAIEVLEDYIARHPLAFKELSLLFLGERTTADREAARRLAEKMPMVAFHPGHASSSPPRS